MHFSTPFERRQTWFDGQPQSAQSPAWHRLSEPHVSFVRQSLGELQAVPLLGGGVEVPGTHRLDESHRYPDGHWLPLLHCQSTQRSSRSPLGQR